MSVLKFGEPLHVDMSTLKPLTQMHLSFGVKDGHCCANCKHFRLRYNVDAYCWLFEQTAEKPRTRFEPLGTACGKWNS